MLFGYRDHPIQALTPDRPDQSFAEQRDVERPRGRRQRRVLRRFRPISERIARREGGGGPVHPDNGEIIDGRVFQ